MLFYLLHILGKLDLLLVFLLLKLSLGKKAYKKPKLWELIKTQDYEVVWIIVVCDFVMSYSCKTTYCTYCYTVTTHFSLWALGVREVHVKRLFIYLSVLLFQCLYLMTNSSPVFQSSLKLWFHYLSIYKPYSFKISNRFRKWVFNLNLYLFQNFFEQLSKVFLALILSILHHKWLYFWWLFKKIWSGLY